MLLFLIKKHCKGTFNVKVFNLYNLTIILYPIQAIGTYAIKRSKTINQIGPESIHFILIPPTKNIQPIDNENFVLLLAAIAPAMVAPANYPGMC